MRRHQPWHYQCVPKKIPRSERFRTAPGAPLPLNAWPSAGSNFDQFPVVSFINKLMHRDKDLLARAGRFQPFTGHMHPGTRFPCL